MRGTGCKGYYDQITTRITPAHAGNRYRKERVYGVFGDHPRSCGEQLDSQLVPRPPAGITPAHAGNSKVLAVLSAL